MSLAALLNKIAVKHKQRRQSRLSDYRGLVHAIADGKEPDDEQIAELLHDTDKSIEQLKHAVEQQERAQLLDDNLVEIGRAIVRLEERERELREKLLEP